jgi:hypothetical protein
MIAKSIIHNVAFIRGDMLHEDECPSWTGGMHILRLLY